MGYIIGYEINCTACHKPIGADVVFVDHELRVRCPSCNGVYKYPKGLCPKGTESMNGRYVCGTCDCLAHFGRQAGAGWEFRCNSCLVEETTQALRKHPAASSAKEIRGQGIVALVIGLALAAWTVSLALKESGWFVLTGCFALGILALSANYLLRTERVAAESVTTAQRAEELLAQFEDEHLGSVDKLTLVGLNPGGLWSAAYLADALKRRQD